MTAPQRFRKYFRVLVATSAMILASVTADAAVFYVTQGGTGNKDGSSWANAYDEAAFPAAIASPDTVAGDEFWVKAGVYHPSTTNDATASFVLKNGVALYGGFNGTETSSAGRNPAANLTVLTGDLTNNDEGKVNGVTVSADQIVDTNSNCVVKTGPDCGPTTILDGFTVTAGDDNAGISGGMYIENSSPTVTNCAFSGNRGGNGGGLATSNSHAVIEDCVFSGNRAGENGGGMYDKGGDLKLRRCTFSGNRADINGGGMAIMDGSTTEASDCTFSGNAAPVYTNGNGGGMYNDESAPTVTNCAFSDNSAVWNGGGMCNSHSSPTVTNCTFSRNTIGNNGGGMSNSSGSAAVVTNCVFSDNRTEWDGGGMYNDASAPAVTNCTFSGNYAGEDGGGMRNNNNSTPAVTDCTFSGNTAGSGGGMSVNNSNPAVRNCTFSGNSATQYGGGMYNNDSSDPKVTNSTFSGNIANKGGGMYIKNSNPTVTNCTFSGNSALVDGGGMCNYGSSVPVVRNCTFSGNSAGGAYGGGMSNAYNTGAPIVTNSIFWGDTGGEIVIFGAAPIVTYSIVEGGYSGTGNLNVNPNLGPLAWNGGPTQTHALPEGSPAINKGKTFDASVISTDQRGVARPQGASFDIGAYEYWEKQILTVKIIGNGSVTPLPPGEVVGSTGKCWGYDNGASVTLTAVEDARSWFDAWGGDASGPNPTTTVTMSAPRTVEASFDIAWLVTVSAGPGGDITPSAPGAGNPGAFAPRDRGASGTTTVKVRDGADKTFTVTPNAGYSIGLVRVDGTVKILGAGSKYTFTDVTEDHTIEATFTASPTPTIGPVPTATPSVTPTPTASPTPVPTPDPRIPLPKVTLTITLYAGGTVVAGPIDITDPSLLSSPSLLAQLLATDPAAILSGNYNMDLVRFFSLVADLDDGVLDFTILFEVTVEGVPAGYRAQLFMLTRTFDSKGNPTGYAIVPRSEGSSVFRKGSGARGWTETWRVTVRDGSAGDGDARRDGSVAPQIAAVVAVFPMATPIVSPTRGSTGSGGGCSLPANGGAPLAALLLLAPVVLMRRR